MARAPSTMLELGTLAPDFSLKETSGKLVTRDSLKGDHGLLVMFICNHCPFVVHVRDELAKIGREYAQRGIGILGINSNDPISYPADNFENMKIEKQRVGYSFPYALDETQDVAKSFRAACTPDFYLFDKHLRLVYRGQLDDSRPGNSVLVTGVDLRRALDAVCSGQMPAKEQKPSLGCNIKWRAGNEPDYFRL